MRKLCFFLLSIFIISCSESDSINYNNKYITIAGKADGLINSDVKIFNEENILLAFTKSDNSGYYSVELEKSKLSNYYILEVESKNYKTNDFPQTLSAFYTFNEDNLLNSNVTLVTSLIYKYASILGEKNLKSRVSSAIAKFDSIGLIKKEEWNFLSSEYFLLDSLKDYVLLEKGFDFWFESIKAEIDNNSYSRNTAKYFPNVNGGIASVRVDSVNNVDKAFKGRVFTQAVKVNLFNIKKSRSLSYDLLKAPEGMTINSQGVITYPVLKDAETKTHKYSLVITDLETGIRHEIFAKLDVMDTSIVLEASFDSSGGKISSDCDDYVLSIAPNAVKESTKFKIYRAVNKDTGFYEYFIDTGLNSVVVDFKYPKELKPKLSDTKLFAKNNRFNAMNEIKTFYANFYWLTSNKRVKNSLGKRAVTNSYIKMYESAKLHKYKGLREHSVKKPVLLVHGYQPLFEMANDSYWKDTARLLDKKGYTVYEFRWITNARFVDAADDLADAIEIISRDNNKKVNIIAHSFGGLLSRAYLQGYAVEKTYNDQVKLRKYNNDVESLITVGTPHSGIFDRNYSSYNGIYAANFPLGQDSWGFEGCNQTSCHQAGESTALNISDTKRNLLYGFPKSPGELVYKLFTMEQGHRMPVDTFVLIGLTINERFFRKDVYESGDALITYEGQRFLPLKRSISKPTSNRAIYLPGGKIYKEKVIGASDLKKAIPGGTILRNNLGEGYCHSSGVCAGGLGGAFSGSRGSYQEVGIESEHWHTYKEIISWLSLYEPTPITVR